MTTEHNDYDSNTAPTDHARGFVDGEKHPARVVACLWDKAQRGGLCLALKLRITTGPRAGECLTGRLYFDTDRADDKGRTAADRSMEALDAMGCNGDLESIVDGDGAGVLDQGDVEIVVGINTKGYPGAKFINPPSSGGGDVRAFDAPSEGDKRSFFAQMKARAQANGMRAKASGTAPARQAAPVARPAPAQRQPPPATRGQGIGRPAAPIDESADNRDFSDDIPF